MTAYQRNPRLAAYIDEQVAARPREATLVRKLWKVTKEAGTPITSFFDGEEHGEIVSKQNLLDIVFNLDEVWLYTSDDRMIFLVLGQFPDTISDYSVSLDEIIQPIYDWAERWDN